MHLQELVGLDYRTTNHTKFYMEVVNALGGAKALNCYIPFPMDTIKASFMQDSHFNTNLTPIEDWQEAVCIIPGNKDTEVRIKPTPLLILLYKKDVNCIALSEGICILKEAARMLIHQS